MKKVEIASLAGLFIKSLPHLMVTKQKKLTVSEDTNGYLRDPDKTYSKLFGFCSDDIKTEILTLVGAAHIPLEKGVHGGELHETLINLMVGTPRDRVVRKATEEAEEHDVEGGADPATTPFSLTGDTPLSEMLMIRNVGEKKDGRLYDQTRDLIYHKYNYEYVDLEIKNLLGKNGYAAWLQTNRRECLFTYAPLRPRFFDDVASPTDRLLCNLWNDAEWKRGYAPDAKVTEPPVELATFMGHLFPEEQSRHYAYAWLRDCTFKRAVPVLILCGKQGAGKNIFIESLAEALVGQDNSRKAQAKFEKSSFHNGIANCRLFFLDESALGPELRDQLKAYYEGVATIERKGKDVGGKELLHASIALANNFGSKIKLEYGDRKFFVPVLSKLALKDTWGEDNITAFTTRLRQDADFVRQIASYLHTNYAEDESLRFPKTPLFRELCVNSYPEEFRTIIEMLKTRPVCNSGNIRGMTKRISALYIKEMIADYELQMGEGLGELKINPDGRWSIESKCYQGVPTGVGDLVKYKAEKDKAVELL